MGNKKKIELPWVPLYPEGLTKKEKNNPIITNMYIGAHPAIALGEHLQNERYNAENRSKFSYIGGTTAQVRKKLWQVKPKIKAAVDSVANAYGINPQLLKDRLDVEGFTDRIIKGNNNAYLNPVDIKNDFLRQQALVGAPEDSILYNPRYSQAAMEAFGTDDAGTLIKEGKVKLINEKWKDGVGINEKGRSVNPAEGITNLDNIGITAATLKYFRDEAKKRNPKLTGRHLDEAAGIYYNRGITGGQNYLNNKK